MIIENSYLTHSNGKILSILGFGLMSLYMLVCFGIGFTGWYNGFFQFIRDVASWGFLAGMFFSAVGSFLMYNESRDMNEIILCGTLLVSLVFQFIPSPHYIVTLIFNLFCYLYLAAFAFAAFKNENKTFAIIFAALLVFCAIIGPLVSDLAWTMLYEVFGRSFFGKIICYPVKNLVLLVNVAAPALCLLETTKKELKKA